MERREKVPSLKTLQRAEQEGRFGKPELVELIAEVSGCSVDWILTGEGRGPSQGGAIKKKAETLTVGPAPAPGGRPGPLSARQEETAAMAGNAVQRALRLVQSNLHGKRDRHVMAEELERFADRLKARLGLEGIAADLYKAALELRKDDDELEPRRRKKKEPIQ